MESNKYEASPTRWDNPRSRWTMFNRGPPVKVYSLHHECKSFSEREAMGVQHLQKLVCPRAPSAKYGGLFDSRLPGLPEAIYLSINPLAKWRCELHRLSMVLARHCHRVGLKTWASGIILPWFRRKPIAIAGGFNRLTRTYLPLWKMMESLGMMTFPIFLEIHENLPNHQIETMLAIAKTSPKSCRLWLLSFRRSPACQQKKRHEEKRPL